jgi:hypothetical protein
MIVAEAQSAEFGHYVQMVVPSPTPRRISPPSWLDLRLILGVVLVIGSVAAGAYLISAADHTDRVLAVTRDLSAGTILHADDVTTVSVRLSRDSTGHYLTAGTPIDGKRLARPIARGELLPAAALQAIPALTTVTVPLATGQAPRLSTGQRIELWISTKRCPSAVLLYDVTVQAVQSIDPNALASDADQSVTLSLPPEQANRVVTALAIEDVTVRAGVLSGPDITGSLPDLSTCAAAPTSS